MRQMIRNKYWIIFVILIAAVFMIALEIYSCGMKSRDEKILENMKRLHIASTRYGEIMDNIKPQMTEEEALVKFGPPTRRQKWWSGDDKEWVYSIDGDEVFVVFRFNREGIREGYFSTGVKLFEKKMRSERSTRCWWQFWM